MRALEKRYDEDLARTEHRPYPLAAGMWRLRQRWLDLLFAHWPIPVEELRAKLPAGLEPDVFDGSAWLGVVPFRMDQVRSRVLGAETVSVPWTTSFLELNLRTYVRSKKTGRQGVYFFALDCSSAFSVLGARALFHLPYFPAQMAMAKAGGVFGYSSRRILSGAAAEFGGSYGPAGPVALTVPRTLEAFLTERYCLFTTFLGRLLVGEIHHLPWPLQPGFAEIAVNGLPAAHGFRLPEVAPVLHFARELRVSLWGLVGEE